ncbi:NAD-dependent epimerase/dehydratase family protein [Arsenicitalea aurantiaca]|nr:NAD-dependent epimerase/dehydratase family protein [Arsenicitalea aurantiaca]
MDGKGLVLVTGATGFVGKWTVISLLRAGYAVRGSVRDAGKAEMVRAAVRQEVGAEAVDRLDFVVLDLLDDAGWAEAMSGVSSVMHVATVIRGDEPKDPQIVVRPAMEGTARVMRFAHEAGVNRVIITSSIATVGYGHGQVSGRRTYTEEDFTNLAGMRWTWAYCIGKTRAEQAAWAFAREHGMALTTIHPGMILGPALDADASISLGAVTGLLDGTTPAMPNIGFSVSDVRDVADLHVAALERPEAAGERYLATGRYLWFREIADILRAAYPDRTITQKIVPDWIMRALAYMGGPVRQIINDIGNEKHFDGAKGEALLGRPFRSAEDAVLGAAESAIRLGLLKAPQGKKAAA